MLDVDLPNLKFPKMNYGKNEVPWDLRPLLYMGGAGTHSKVVNTMIETGQLGNPLLERIDLVCKLHEVLINFLERGGRRATVRGQIVRLREFFRWSDESGTLLTLESVEQNYLSWADSLLHRVRVGIGLSEKSAYLMASVVGWVLDRVLVRSKPIAKSTRLRKPRSGIRAISRKADKQNLEDTFAFGNFLLDIADGLSVDAIWGPLPVRIQVRNGKDLEEWSGLKRSATLKPPSPKHSHLTRQAAKQSARKRNAWSNNTSLRTRYPLINLRILAEMFMLMGQPAVNHAQAHQLRMDQWRYKASTNGYEVRTYKHRRLGPVEFEIYSEYREVFERYLRWRAAIFPDDPDGLLFPLIGYRLQISRHPETAPSHDRLRDCCKRAGIKFLPPTTLRNTNVNWMLRRTLDPDLTAEEKQHTKKILLGVYEKPNQQRAMLQIQSFWSKHDPALAAVGPGSCVGKTPEPIPDMPITATEPDCITPAGCLFCTHQRDIDSFNHVWSLASYRLLKSFELAGYSQLISNKSLHVHPAEVAIERLTAKLNYIKTSGSHRESWVSESLLRIEEGRYHPDWAWMIESY